MGYIFSKSGNGLWIFCYKGSMERCALWRKENKYTQTFYMRKIFFYIYRDDNNELSVLAGRSFF